MAETDNMNLALPASNEYVDVEVLNENFRKLDAAVLLALAAAAPYSAQTYALGAYCTRGGRLYRCTTAITAAETWTAAHWTETTVTAELIAHATSKSNPHGVTAAQAGAYSKGETDTLLANKNTSNLGYIPSDADLLTWAASQTTGGVFCASPLNTNIPESQYFVCILSIGGNEFREITACGNNGNIWRNVYVSNGTGFSWLGWERLATATDLDTKVSKSGDTINGNITFDKGDWNQIKMILSNGDTAYFEASNYEINMQLRDGDSTDNRRCLTLSDKQSGLDYALKLYDITEGSVALYGVLHTGNAQALGFPKIAIGSYVGTGTYSSANPNSLTFDFEPKVVIIVQNSHDNFPGTVFIRGQTLSGTIGENYISNSQLTVSWNGKTVSWYSNNSSYKDRGQLNISGNTYFYVALG